MTKSIKLIARFLLTACTLAMSFSTFAAIEVYVNPLVGKDSNPGTDKKPYKSITRALRNDVAGNTLLVHLSAGNYSIQSGEQFPWAIYGSTTLQGPSSGTASLNDTTFEQFIDVSPGGRLNMSRMSVTGFYISYEAGLQASYANMKFRDTSFWARSTYNISFDSATFAGGDLTLLNSQAIVKNTVFGGKGARRQPYIALDTRAALRGDNILINNASSPNKAVVEVRGGSSFELKNSRISNSCGFSQHTETASLYVSDPFTYIMLTNSAVTGNPCNGILIDSEASAIIYGGDISSNTTGVKNHGSLAVNNNSDPAMLTTFSNNKVRSVFHDGKVTHTNIRKATFDGGITGVEAHNIQNVFTIKESSFKNITYPIFIGSTSIATDIHHDSITFSGSGNISNALYADCDHPNTKIYVTNSTWIANQQGADSKGKMRPNSSAVGPADGKNFRLTNSNCALLF
jgi:hypothetical protein